MTISHVHHKMFDAAGLHTVRFHAVGSHAEAVVGRITITTFAGNSAVRVDTRQTIFSQTVYPSCVVLLFSYSLTPFESLL